MWPWRDVTITRTKHRALVDHILRSPVDRRQQRFRRRLAVLCAAALAAVALRCGAHHALRGDSPPAPTAIRSG